MGLISPSLCLLHWFLRVNEHVVQTNLLSPHGFGVFLVFIVKGQRLLSRESLLLLFWLFGRPLFLGQVLEVRELLRLFLNLRFPSLLHLVLYLLEQLVWESLDQLVMFNSPTLERPCWPIPVSLLLCSCPCSLPQSLINLLQVPLRWIEEIQFQVLLRSLVDGWCLTLPSLGRSTLLPLFALTPLHLYLLDSVFQCNGQRVCIFFFSCSFLGYWRVPLSSRPSFRFLDSYLWHRSVPSRSWWSVIDRLWVLPPSTDWFLAGRLTCLDIPHLGRDRLRTQIGWSRSIVKLTLRSISLSPDLASSLLCSSLDDYSSFRLSLLQFEFRRSLPRFLVTLSLPQLPESLLNGELDTALRDLPSRDGGNGTWIEIRTHGHVGRDVQITGCPHKLPSLNCVWLRHQYLVWAWVLVDESWQFGELISGHRDYLAQTLEVEFLFRSFHILIQ